ncbi:MAG TPA: prolyl oligopeptidase family serine peptidase [Candidatus Bathyarchaeia archaeon]|nr:prolyl oligopeptidase family serine peptidase [Candidatus Bathyarchaeia archaeon]
MNNTSVEKYKPSINDFINLPKVASSKLSPDGEKIVYLLVCDDLEKNDMKVKCHIIDIITKQNFRLTETGMALNPIWVNNHDIALRRLLPSSKNGFQIYVYENLKGEGIQITDHPGGIGNFLKFKDGFIFQARDNIRAKKYEEMKFGNYIHFEEEQSTSAIYYIDYNKAKEHFKESNTESFEKESNFIRPIINLTELLDKPYNIQSFKVSEKTSSIFLNCSSKDDLYYENDTFCSKIDIDVEAMIEEILTSTSNFNLNNYATITPLNLPKGAVIEEVSPNGEKLLISFKERELKQYILSDLFLLDLTKMKEKWDHAQIRKQLICITRNFDRKPNHIVWSQAGIFVSYANESIYEIAKISETGEVDKLDFGEVFPRYYFSVADNGRITFNGLSSKSLREIYLGKPINNTHYQLTQLTNHTEYTNNWDFGSVESIKWKSRDGLEIQGIIRKPSDFDTKKKYPLLFLNHGGPSGFSSLAMVEDDELYYFPTIQLCNKGVIIAKVNYRGSMGKGQKFHEIGVDNVGIGDLWDIESCIDNLVSQGFIDETKIGSLGWSQGGFISAFLGMHSKRFTAVSVGAGVSSWYTYFITSDLRNSLNISGHPFEPGKMEIYQKTAPISGIAEANTPMLLLHGENDQRIGLTSAMELYRALKEKGVPTELFIFKGKGHGLDTPKENFACMMLNYQWFKHYLLGEELKLSK